MRILTIGNMFPPHHLGGYELVWQSAVRHLREAGHQVRVLTTDHRIASPSEAEGSDVHRQLRWYWRDHDFPRLGAVGRLRLELHNARILDRHLIDYVPDLVSWWAMGGMSLSLIEQARRAGHSSNAVVCDEWLLYGAKVDQWSRALAGRPRLRPVVEALSGLPGQVDLRAVGPVLFPSETLRSGAAEAIGLLETEVCPQGVDTELFQPAPERPWGWRLSYVGRIDCRKGLGLALQALGELPPEATLSIVGPGDDRYLGDLRRDVDVGGLGGRVSFGVSSRQGLPAVYAAADAVVFPVLWQEPWGLVPLEAMAMGRPVVATGRGGSGEYLRDGENCVLFDADEGAPALAAALRRLESDHELRTRVREGGLRTVASLSERRWNEAVERLCLRAGRFERPVSESGGAEASSE